MQTTEGDYPADSEINSHNGNGHRRISSQASDFNTAPDFQRNSLNLKSRNLALRNGSESTGHKPLQSNIIDFDNSKFDNGKDIDTSRKLNIAGTVETTEGGNTNPNQMTKDSPTGWSDMHHVNKASMSHSEGFGTKRSGSEINALQHNQMTSNDATQETIESEHVTQNHKIENNTANQNLIAVLDLKEHQQQMNEQLDSQKNIVEEDDPDKQVSPISTKMAASGEKPENSGNKKKKSVKKNNNKHKSYL